MTVLKSTRPFWYWAVTVIGLAIQRPVQLRSDSVRIANSNNNRDFYLMNYMHYVDTLYA